MKIRSAELLIGARIPTIVWEDEDGNFGNLTFEENGAGKYIVDAEYLSIESVFAIIQKLTPPQP